jgi:hypothetical protein
VGAAHRCRAVEIRQAGEFLDALGDVQVVIDFAPFRDEAPTHGDVPGPFAVGGRHGLSDLFGVFPGHALQLAVGIFGGVDVAEQAIPAFVLEGALVAVGDEDGAVAAPGRHGAHVGSVRRLARVIRGTLQESDGQGVAPFSQQEILPPVVVDAVGRLPVVVETHVKPVRQDEARRQVEILMGVGIRFEQRMHLFQVLGTEMQVPEDFGIEGDAFRRYERFGFEFLVEALFELAHGRLLLASCKRRPGRSAVPRVGSCGRQTRGNFQSGR